MKSVCVYCGSSLGVDTAWTDATKALARHMVDSNLALIYGGGNVGLMGVVADEVMRLGGEATGVIPKALLDKEVGHPALTRMHVVKDMHERKAMMASLADGFVALPGGFGTLEELFETLTWSQLGFHDKPIGLFNALGFYDGLIAFLLHLVRQGFLKAEHASLLIDDRDPLALLTRLKSFQPQRADKLLNRTAALSLLP